VEQGKFHALADAILPWAFPALVGLRKYGVNAEGKTKKGVPDSYVGDSPKTCRAAVEYTTQRTDQAKKVAHDYDEVRGRCSSATVIVLCTSRSLDGIDVSATTKKASTDGITIEIVDGHRLALYLNERQDLRFEYLSIPIGAHTLPSLVARGHKALGAPIERNLPEHALKLFLPRARASQVLAERLRENPSTTLVVALAGMGKSTWSAAEAMRFAAGRFVTWMPAKRLALDDPDPIGIHLCHTAYGVSDPARLVELADLLQRERATACSFIDGIDEVHDFALVDRALQAFRNSALGALTHLVLICRSGALGELESALAITSDIAERGRSRITLDEFTKDEAGLLLTRHGATAEEVHALLKWLPVEFRGTPLFLVAALRAHRSDHLRIATSSDIVGVLADHFARDIAGRLKRDGRGPSVEVVRRFLQDVAISAFKNSQQLVPREALSEFPSGDLAGENSPTSRAVQSGLLFASDEGIGFSHPLFLEHFAARGLEASQGSWGERLNSMRPASSYRFATKLARGMTDPEPFVRALLSVDGVAACEAAGRINGVLSPDLAEDLVKVPKQLLSSRFPSDRERALRLLGALRSAAAANCAVEWWNKATTAERGLMAGAVADAFLELRLDPAIPLVMNHYQLRQPAGMPWYEPAFVRRLEALPTDFAGALCDEAFRRLKKGENSGGALMVLAVLRDERLVPWLDQAMSQRLLRVEEHRALIHLNVPESIDVFVRSVDRHLAARALLEERDDREAKEKRHEHDDSVVILMSDIGMYPHEQLLPAIGAALESPRRDHVWFGMQWADLLPDLSLVSAYSAARLRYSQYSFAIGARLVEQLLKVLPMPQIESLFRSVDEKAQKLIVHHMFYVSDPDAESFLVGLLDNPAFRFDAIQSLGMIYAYGAAAAVARHADDSDRHVRYMCLKTLGRLRYAPILGRLLDELSAVFAKQLPAQRSVEDQEFEYTMVGALSKIGGDKALAWLVNHMKDLAHPAEGVKALLNFRDEGVEHLSALVAARVVAPEALTEALSRRRVRLMFARGARPWIKNEVLFEAAARFARDGERESQRASHSPCFALAEFDLPQATAALVKLATDPNASVHNVEEARLLLTYIGVEPFASESLNAEIARLQEQPYAWDPHVRHLRGWTRDLVRRALIQRLSNGSATVGLLSAFQWFCTSEDRSIFERYEADPRIAVADVAHRYLMGEARH
jgi:hypothetical protein